MVVCNLLLQREYNLENLIYRLPDGRKVFEVSRERRPNGNSVVYETHRQPQDHFQWPTRELQIDHPAMSLQEMVVNREAALRNYRARASEVTSYIQGLPVGSDIKLEWDLSHFNSWEHKDLPPAYYLRKQESTGRKVWRRHHPTTNKPYSVVQQDIVMDTITKCIGHGGKVTVIQPEGDAQ